MKIKILLIFLITLFSFKNIQAQDISSIDDTKPTNFYTYFENAFEYDNMGDINILGYRGSVALALSDKHLVYGEVPVLYQDFYKEVGVADMRFVYSYLPYKNYEKFFGAVMTSMDVVAPTGDYEKGIGVDRWIFSPSVTMGLMVNKNFQFFPVISYHYTSKMVNDDTTSDMNGGSFRLMCPIIINNKLSSQITPNFYMYDFNNKEVTYIQEFLLSYTVNRKMNLNMLYAVNFEQETYLTRFSLKWFF